ncbi:MAG: ABC transporter substrate-binding protein [Sphingomonadaceae bacterium]
MRHFACIRYFAAALLLPLALAACGSQDEEKFRVIVIGEPDDPFETGMRLSAAGQMVRAATREGLVAFDEEGRIVPALADRWIVTDDGLSYIFRLRDGTWEDGSEITSNTALRSLRQAIGGLKGTSLGLDLSGIDEIRQMAGRVIEIRLSRPMPDLLQVLAQPELGLAHGGKGTGPMRMVREKQTAVLTPISPEEMGLPAVRDWAERVRPIHLSALPGEAAIEQFNGGDASLVLNGHIQHFPLASSVGILRGSIQPDAATGLFGLKVRRQRGFLIGPLNREAIAMAIDREALIDQFGIDGWVATTRVIPPGLEDDTGMIGERWALMSIEERRAIAASRVAAWKGSLAGDAAQPIAIWMPRGPGADMLFERLSEDLGGIGLALERVEKIADADMQLVDSVARYPRVLWFFNRMSCKSWSDACDPAADKRVLEANAEEIATERVERLAEAEELLTEANVFIPFGAPIRWSLVSGDVEGFSINRWAWHPLMPMALLPR